MWWDPYILLRMLRPVTRELLRGSAWVHSGTLGGLCIDDGVCGQVPHWTSELIYLQQVEATEPEENPDLSTGGWKGDLRVRQDHKMEEKPDAKNETIHGANYAVRLLRFSPLSPSTSSFHCGLGACKMIGLEGTKYRPQNETVRRSSKSIPRQQLSPSVD